MIDGRCFTNLDGYHNVTWPQVFCSVPRVGEWVEGERNVVNRPKLKVVAVTHTVKSDGRPAILVELHH